MLFARGNRIFLRANGFDFFFSCLKVCKLTRATVCIYICNLVFVHFERHRVDDMGQMPGVAANEVAGGLVLPSLGTTIAIQTIQFLLRKYQKG